MNSKAICKGFGKLNIQKYKKWILFAVVELVAYVAHSIDKIVTRNFYLAAQASDMYVHRPVTAEIVMSPDFIEEGFSGEYPAFVGSQQF
jgi:hypothetical protein